MQCILLVWALLCLSHQVFAQGGFMRFLLLRVCPSHLTRALEFRSCEANIEALGSAWIRKDAEELARVFETAILLVQGIPRTNLQTTPDIYRNLIFPVAQITDYRAETVLPHAHNCSYRIVNWVTNVATGQIVGGIPDGQNLVGVSWRPDGTIAVYERVYIDRAQQAINQWVNQANKRTDEGTLFFL